MGFWETFNIRISNFFNPEKGETQSKVKHSYHFEEVLQLFLVKRRGQFTHNSIYEMLLTFVFARRRQTPQCIQMPVSFKHSISRSERHKNKGARTTEQTHALPVL